ncbi:MAG: asparagine synthase (glutamine-hydrolyzing) [Burkholderiaceae bacterium]|nr:asparagine synthase (glutamine-hydrolyzing) [Burkholderiaceae bacterium]
MCGISGKLNFDRGEPVPSALLERMTDVIQHRGPDGAGHYRSGPVGLGHRRLSIIDLATGAQPMSNEDGSVWVVFNGEIYNFEALRRELVACGHQFKSTSDTEVIVHLYEEVGDACVARCEGMFAFALWDERRQRLLLARDRVGIKPLYYADTGRAIVFGSEIKSIIQDPSVRRHVDLGAVDRFLTYYYCPGDLAPLAGIRKLAPGHFLSVEGDRVRTTRYWDLVFSTPSRSPNLGESAEALGALLDHTVKRHMISDVPVGVLLSGGVDSTGMLHFASSDARRPLHSFTMGFAGTDVADERPFARLAAGRFGSVHHETTLTAEAFRDFLPDYVWHMEELVCEPPAIALHFVARLAHEHGVKVLLSGEGGDEAFAGYPEYRNLAALEALKAGAGRASGLLNLGFNVLGRAGWRRADHYRALVDQSVADYYFSRTSTPGSPFNRFKSRLYGPALSTQASAFRADAPTRQLLQASVGQPLLNRLLDVDTKSWLPDDLLIKADKMTMAASVELRVPLLDHRVLEFAASLPTRHKARGWSMKRVLKKVLEPVVPAEILNRKKAGFPVPYDRWMRHELRDFVHDTVLASGSFTSQYLHRAVVEDLLESHRKGACGAKEVFSLLTLELWYRRFVREDSTAAESTSTPAPSANLAHAPA